MIELGTHRRMGNGCDSPSNGCPLGEGGSRSSRLDLELAPVKRARRPSIPSLPRPLSLFHILFYILGCLETL